MPELILILLDAQTGCYLIISLHTRFGVGMLSNHKFME